MKIGIFTFHCAANYGAVLQTYCLQEVLKDMGHEVYVIDYRPDYLLKPYKTFYFDSNSYSSFFSKVKGFLRACLVVPIRWKRNKEFSKFVNRRLHLYKLDLNDEANDFDAFVFGSDQIWNPKITNGFDRIYLGDFPAAKGKKLIAYAASVGSVKNISSGNIDYFLSRLKTFDMISVREKTLAMYIQDNISVKTDVVLDPVLLAGSDILYRFNVNRENNKMKNFLLLFQIGHDKHIAQNACRIAHKMNLEFIDIITMGESLFESSILQSVRIEKLLECFSRASIVLTTSFHGTAISILFKKEFYTISVNSVTDERAALLLESLDLNDRMIKNGSILYESCIDYNLVYTKYKNLVHDSLEVLREKLIYE